MICKNCIWWKTEIKRVITLLEKSKRTIPPFESNIQTDYAIQLLSNKLKRNKESERFFSKLKRNKEPETQSNCYSTDATRKRVEEAKKEVKE